MKEVGNSFKGILGGVIVIIIGVVLLWWNEGNNVKNLKTTAEMEKIFIDVKSDSIDSKNDGKLVATSGKLINEEELTDSMFGVTVKTPIMRRIVEMYQWDEDSSTHDGKTRYTYKKKWNDTLIDSSSFHKSGHENPSQKLYENEIYTSSDVKVGAFSLSSQQINRLSTNRSYTDFNQDIIGGLNLKISENYITNSNDLNNPAIGDIRISFNYNASTEVSVLAVQTGSSFSSFTSSVGKNINKIMDGTHTGKEMIESIKAENNFLKWILRLVGALLCIIGFGTILKPISTISGFIPILGGVVGMAVELISFVLGLCLSLIVIAIAWIRFRPLVGIGLIAIAAALIAFLILRGKKTDVNEQNNIQQPTNNL